MAEEAQWKRLLRLLSDGRPHSTVEIQNVVYGGEHLGTARIASRMNDLRGKGYKIPKAVPDKDNPTVFWYQLNGEARETDVPKKRERRIERVMVDGVLHVREVWIEA